MNKFAYYIVGQNVCVHPWSIRSVRYRPAGTVPAEIFIRFLVPQSINHQVGGGHVGINIEGKLYSYSVMQSDRNSFCGDVVGQGIKG